MMRLRSVDDVFDNNDEEEDDGNGAAFDAISDVISIFGHDASMNVGFSWWVTIFARFPASSSFKIFFDLSSTSFWRFLITDKHSAFKSSRSDTFVSSFTIVAASASDGCCVCCDAMIGVDVAGGCWLNPDELDEESAKGSRKIVNPCLCFDGRQWAFLATEIKWDKNGHIMCQLCSRKRASC